MYKEQFNIGVILNKIFNYKSNINLQYYSKNVNYRQRFTNKFKSVDNG